MELLQKSLTARLLTYFLFLTILPLAVVGYIAYRSGRQSIVDNVESHLNSVAILKEHQIKNWVEHLKHSTILLATNPNIIKDVHIISTHAVDDPEYLKAYDSLVSEFKRITNLEHISPVFLLDSDSGRVIASSDTSWEGKFRETEPYFIRGKTEIYESDIFWSLTLGRPTMVISAPIKDSDGKLLGVMVAHANLESLSEIMLERSGLGETGETFLVNSSNLLITNTLFAPDGAFKKWIFGQGAVWALEGKTGVGLFVDYREVPVIGAYRWLGDLRLVLIAKQDRSEAFAAIYKLGLTILGIGVLVVLAAVLIYMFFARAITRPIYRLTEGAEIIGAGNLDYKVGTVAKDEIGKLSRAFDKMTKNLKEITVSRNELAQEVVERKKAEEALEESEERYRELFENINSGVAVYEAVDNGEDFIFKGFNKAGEKIDHIERKDVIGRRLTEAFPGVKEFGLFEVLQRVWRTGKEEFFPSAIYKDEREPGAWRENWVYKLPTGEIIAVYDDITERRRTELALKESEEIYRSFVQNFQGIAFQGNIDFTPIFFHGNVEKITGYTEEEFISGNPSWDKIIHTDDTKYISDSINMISSVPNFSTEREYRIIRKDRQIKWVYENIKNITDDFGKPFKVQGVITDITDRKRAEDKLKEYSENLEVMVEERTKELQNAQEELVRKERLAVLGQLSGGVSHELRNPLGVINNAIYYLKTILPDANETTKEYLDIISSEVQNSEKIVSDLLDFSRIKSSEREETVVSDLVDMVLTKLSPPDDVKVITDIATDIPQIYIDPRQIGQVFDNLVTNAYHAMPEGGELKIEGKAVKKNVHIFFKDTGSGISKENMAKLFEPLFTTKARGIGLGLSVSKNLVEANGGRIEVKSEEKKGSIFTVILPTKGGKS